MTSRRHIFNSVQHGRTLPRIGARASVLLLCLGALLLTTTVGCGSKAESTGGAGFSPAAEVLEAHFHPEGAVSAEGGSIDVSCVSQGYVAASATSAARLKFQVSCGEQSYNYDLPSDGTPIVCPLNMGNGSYAFRIMRNTSGTNYVETTAAEAQVSLESDIAPYLRPNVFCNYTKESACVAKARELVSGASNQGEAVKAICTYVVENVSYDTEKAESLSGKSGYIPNPDETLSSRKGICFDYASLGCAMLRSVGIPTQIVTGYVSPGDIYHAWVMVYIDGSWQSAQFSVDPNTWSRVDLTFAAASDAANFVGDGKTYTNRYLY